MLILKAPVVWGFSSLRVEQYQRKAIELNLAMDNQWLKLGHYERSWMGGYQSKIRGSFFLDESGATDPVAELQKTIQILFSAPEVGQVSKQCRYLLRTRWLAKQLNVAKEDLVSCPERDKWKAEFAATRATLIFAAADLGNAASSFGHTFLKLSSDKNAGGKELLDYGVNYAANTADGKELFFAIKGLTGFYPGVFTMLPYHQKIREYTNLDGRNIWEYELSLSPEEVDKLVDHLLELEGTWIPYYFLTDNCSYQLLSLFEVVRPKYELSSRTKYFVAPVDTVKIVKQYSDLIKDRRFRKSLKNDFNEDYAKLSYQQRRALKGAVDKLNVEDSYGLAVKEKAEVYEAGMKYFALKGYSSEKNYDDEKYKLSVARAQLGMVTKEKEQTAEFPPDESHDSSGIYLGGGREGGQQYSALKFRHVYHDLISDDSGSVPFSHNEIFSFEFRHFADLRKTELANWTILNLLSSDAVTALRTPMTWKTIIGTQPNFLPYGEGGGGYSLDLPLFLRTRAMALLTARFHHVVDQRYFFGVGPEILLVSRLNAQIGALIYTRYFAAHQRTPYLDYGAALSCQFVRNLELQLEYKEKDTASDFKLMLLKSFIL